MRKLYVLHGWAYNVDKWNVFLDGLRKLGIEVELLKTPGLTSPLEEVWNLNDYVEWLKQELGDEENVMLLGHSFGGQIATRFASLYPEKVERLILIDPAGIRDRSIKARIKRTVFGSIAKVGKLLLPIDRLRGVLYRVVREKDYVEASALMQQVMRSVIGDEVIHDLPKITAKTLIIWGSLDQATPVRHAEIFHTGIAGSLLRIVDNARHSPQFTHPEEVVELVRVWL